MARSQRMAVQSGGAVLVRFQSPGGITVPHKITNHSNLELAFQQKDSRKNLLLRVRPRETMSMVRQKSPETPKP